MYHRKVIVCILEHKCYVCILILLYCHLVTENSYKVPQSHLIVLLSSLLTLPILGVLQGRAQEIQDEVYQRKVEICKISILEKRVIPKEGKMGYNASEIFFFVILHMSEDYKTYKVFLKGLKYLPARKFTWMYDACS